MIVVIGEQLIKPGRLDVVQQALNVLLPKARADDGCISYEFSFDIADPNLIRFAERWRDAAAFAAHNAQPHMTDFQSAVMSSLAAAPNVAVYEGQDFQPE